MGRDTNAKNETTREILRNTLKDISPYLTLGMQLGATVVVCFCIGWWLDTEYEWSPWGKIGGAVIGATGGMIKFFQSVKELTKKTNDTENPH